MKYAIGDLVVLNSDLHVSRVDCGFNKEILNRAQILDVVPGHGYRVKIGIQKPIWITEEKIVKRI